jgi:hypothetical protein
MIGNDKQATRLQRIEQGLVHFRPVDGHKGCVVVAEKKGHEVEITKLWVGQVIEGQNHLGCVPHRRSLHARGKLFRSFVILRVDLSPRGNSPRHQFGAVASACGHVEHAPSRLRSDKRQKLFRLAFFIVLTVGIRAIRGGNQSRTLSDVLVELLRASNNYIANQVFLEVGGQRLGGPVSLEKSLQVAREMLAAHELAESMHLEEGAGISRENRFMARGLAKVLELFAPHADLLRGHDGGANKTGTLEGVRTLAGYASTSRHGQVRFVISLRSNNGAVRFQLLRAIEREL